MRFRRILIALLIGMLPMVSHALRFNVNFAFPFVYIQVGSAGAAVDEVGFTFPVGVVPGDGTPIVGVPAITVTVLGFSTAGPPPRTTYTVTMDSSTPLMNGNGDNLPFDQISWTTTDGDLPAGTFDQGTQQTLVTVDQRGNRARGILDNLTFTYANNNVYPAGTYTGTVIYTIANL